jgi:hypothetical protein
MRDHQGIKAVEMTRRIRDAHYAELDNKTPEERLAFYREKARALHSELGWPEEVPRIPAPAPSRNEHR